MNQPVFHEMSVLLPLLYSLFCTDFDGVIEGNYDRSCREVAMDEISFQSYICISKSTPPKFNIAPEKRWLEDVRLSYWVSVTFQGRAVKLPGGTTAI